MADLAFSIPPISQVERHGSGPPERLEMHLSSVCDQRCVFCSESARMRAFAAHPISLASVIRTLIRKKKDGCRHVTFTGGEPTFYPRFPEVLGAAKRLGYKTYMTTDASRISEPSYARRVLPFLDEICVSIHADITELHDGLAHSRGSFARVKKALGHIAAARPRPYLLTNTVMTKFNMHRIESTARWLCASGIVRHCTFSNLAPDGQALADYEGLSPRLSKITALARPLSQLAWQSGVTIRFFGVPSCLLDGQWSLSNDLHWSPRVTVERGMVGTRVGLHEVPGLNPGRMRFYGPKCQECAWKEHRCFGIFKEYYRHYGDAELKPSLNH